MSTLHVVGYRYIAHDQTNRPLSAPKAPAIFACSIEIGAEELFVELPENVAFVCLKAMGDCLVAVGPHDQGKLEFMEAGERLWFGVDPNAVVAVVAYEDD